MPDVANAVYQRISDHAMEFSQDGFTMPDPNSVRDSTMGGVTEMPTDSSKIFAAHLWICFNVQLMCVDV